MPRPRAPMLLVLALCGCGGGDVPPLDELTLRDALQADPATIAALPAGARERLAMRFDEAKAPAGEEVLLPLEGFPWPVAQLPRVDDELYERGEDARLFGELAIGEEMTGWRSWVPSTGSEPPETTPVLEGDAPEPATAAIEEAALAGGAGRIVAELQRTSRASHLTRVTGWPAAALASGDTVYVNASWLVATSPLTAGVLVAPEPAVRPASYTYNPYKLPRTLAECVADVEQHCSCVSSGQCSGDAPADPRFASAAEECGWVAKDAQHPAALCVLMMLSVDAIAQCLPQSCQAGNETQAKALLDDQVCVQALDDCLNDGELDQQSASVDTGCSSCRGTACDSPDCNPRCDTPDCNVDCGDCKGPDCDSPDCKGPDCDAGKCKQCSVASRRPQGGLGALGWLLAPLAYLYLAARRPS